MSVFRSVLEFLTNFTLHFLSNITVRVKIQSLFSYFLKLYSLLPLALSLPLLYLPFLTVCLLSFYIKVLNFLSWLYIAVCPRWLGPFYIVSYYRKWVKTSWTYSHYIIFVFNSITCSSKAFSNFKLKFSVILSNSYSIIHNELQILNIPLVKTLPWCFSFLRCFQKYIRSIILLWIFKWLFHAYISSIFALVLVLWKYLHRYTRYWFNQNTVKFYIFVCAFHTLILLKMFFCKIICTYLLYLLLQ